MLDPTLSDSCKRNHEAFLIASQSRTHKQRKANGPRGYTEIQISSAMSNTRKCKEGWKRSTIREALNEGDKKRRHSGRTHTRQKKKNEGQTVTKSRFNKALPRSHATLANATAGCTTSLPDGAPHRGPRRLFRVLNNRARAFLFRGEALPRRIKRTTTTASLSYQAGHGCSAGEPANTLRRRNSILTVIARRRSEVDKNTYCHTYM